MHLFKRLLLFLVSNMSFFSTVFGLISVAHANEPTLTKWGQNAAGIGEMWTTIGNQVHVDIPAQDIVHALTGGIVQMIFTFIAGASTLLIMYAGIRMVASRGKEDEYSEGKTIITWALIGLVLSLVARVVVLFFAEGFLPAFFN